MKVKLHGKLQRKPQNQNVSDYVVFDEVSGFGFVHSCLIELHCLIFGKGESQIML